MPPPALPPQPTEREAALHRAWREHSFGLITGGFAFFEVMFSATRLGLFTHLAKHPGSSLERIAEGLGLEAYPTRVLLMACASLGLVKSEGLLYTNEPEAAALDLTSPSNILPSLEAYHAIIYRPTFRLQDALKAATNKGLEEIPGEGTSLYRKLEDLPEQDRIFHDWMHAVGRLGGLNETTLPMLDPLLRSSAHLVDYGGGDAANAITLCERYPRLRVTVVDLPKVCGMARENVRAAGLSERISVSAGDFHADEMVPDADVILFAHIFNIYSPEKNRALIAKSYQALKPNGVLLIFNSVSSDTGDGPLGAAMLSLYYLTLATGEGMVYPLSDYDAWMKDGGFTKVKKVRSPSSGNHAFVIGMK